MHIFQIVKREIHFTKFTQKISKDYKCGFILSGIETRITHSAVSRNDLFDIYNVQ